jgi:hypothetical protein
LTNEEADLKDKLFKTVTIKPMGNITGKLVAIYINEAGVQYEVRYIDGKQILCTYFYAEEIEFLE